MGSDVVNHVTVSTLQSNINVDAMSISGTLNGTSDWLFDPFDLSNGYIEEPDYHYLTLDLSDNNFTDLIVAQVSQDGSIINLLDRETKKITIEIRDITKPIIFTQSNGINTLTERYSISAIVLE